MSQTGDHAAGLHDHPDCPYCPDDDDAQLQASIAFAASNLRAIEHVNRDRVVIGREGWDRLQAAIERYVLYGLGDE